VTFQDETYQIIIFVAICLVSAAIAFAFILIFDLVYPGPWQGVFEFPKLSVNCKKDVSWGHHGDIGVRQRMRPVGNRSQTKRQARAFVRNGQCLDKHRFSRDGCG
jgi:hypothetical protein